jgi:hypothetical protein
MPQTAVAGDDAETAHASANGGARCHRKRDHPEKHRPVAGEARDDWSRDRAGDEAADNHLSGRKEGAGIVTAPPTACTKMAATSGPSNKAAGNEPTGGSPAARAEAARRTAQRPQAGRDCSGRRLAVVVRASPTLEARSHQFSPPGRATGRCARRRRLHLDGAPAAGVFGDHHRIAVLVRAARAVDSTPILVGTPPISCTPWPTR